jgi:hypothetical protein
MQYVHVRNTLLNHLMYHIFYGTNAYQDLVHVYCKHFESLALMFIKI